MAVFTALATAALGAFGVTSAFIIGATADETFIEFDPEDKISGARVDKSEDDCG